MPFYIISNESYIKDNKYKFGYSSKSKNELLKQYEINKRFITNPFIINWWNAKGSITQEKNIHNILRNSKKIKHISGEWYECEDLLYLMFIINDQINKQFNISNINNFKCVDYLCKDIVLLQLSNKNQINDKDIFYKLKKNNKENENVNKLDNKPKKPYINEDNMYKCYIYRHENLIDKHHIKAAKETAHEMLHFYELYKGLKDEKDSKKILNNLVIDILKTKKIKHESRTNVTRYKNKIIRCYDIYNEYGERLNNIYFNLNYMAKIDDNNFLIWLKHLDNFISNTENGKDDNNKK